MVHPLDTSRTAVLTPDEATSYFESRNLANDHVGPSIELQQVEKIRSKVGSSSIKQAEKLDEDNISVHSNDTIGNDALDDRDLMYAADAHLEFPEGGKASYLVIFGSFMALVFSFGLFNTLGVIETFISENQLADVKHSTVSWIFSILLFINFLTLVFSGVYFDRNGSRLLVLLGWILITAGFLGTANSTKVWHFILSFSMLVGVGSGFIVSPAFGCIAQYFNRKRGFMTSLATTGGSIGGIIFPLMLRKLYEEIGFVWAMRVCALFSTFCNIIALFFLKERFPKQKIEGTRWKRALSYTSAVDFKGLRDVKFLFVVLGCTLGESSAYVTGTYLASYARAQEKSLSTAYIMISITQACGMPGRWMTGYLSDRFGRFNVMSIVLFVTSVLPFIILLPFGSSTAALLTFAASWGFFSGSVFSLLPVCCGQISRTEEFGRRYGTMYSIVAFGTLAALPIGGAIIGDGNPSQYLNCIVYYSGALMFMSAVCYTISKFYCVGPHIFVKF